MKSAKEIRGFEKLYRYIDLQGCVVDFHNKVRWKELETGYEFIEK